MPLTWAGACMAEQSLSQREEFMSASVSHLFSHLVLVGPGECVGERRESSEKGS